MPVSAAEKSRRWRKRHPERYREVKRRYYASEKGKAQKKKEDAAYIISGGRAKTEARRAAKGLTPARQRARTAYTLLRRTSEKMLDELSKFALIEAVSLSRLRETVVGGEWHVDHVIPVTKGGTSQYTNLQVVPGLWNRRKSNHQIERFFISAGKHP